MGFAEDNREQLIKFSEAMAEALTRTEAEERNSGTFNEDAFKQEAQDVITDVLTDVMNGDDSRVHWVTNENAHETFTRLSAEE